MLSFLDGRRRWLIVALLFSLSVVNYIDRQTLSVLAHTLQIDLKFGDVEYSYVVASFLVAYTLGFAFGGRIIDRVGVKRSVAVALVVWSIAGMLHAFATNWVELAIFRFLLGLGESFYAPAAARAVSEWTPERERGLSMAVISNGFIVGAILAPPLVTALTLHFGWYWAFVITGAIGFVLLILWWKQYDRPEESAAITDAERAYILETRGGAETPEEASASFWSLLTHPLVLAVIFARMLTDSLSYFMSFWLPQYLQTQHAFSLTMVGLLAWIPFLAADIGGPGGGAVSDWLVRRGISVRRARLTMLGVVALIMPISAVAVRVEAAWLALACIAVMLAAQSCWNVNLLTLMTSAAPRRHVATIVGLSGMGGSIGGIISTLLAGKVISTVGYVPVFTVFGFVHMTAFALLLLIGIAYSRRTAEP